MGTGGVACPKPKRGSHGLPRRRRRRLTAENTGTVHDYVFARERNLCRVTGWPAHSMHELRSAGAVGSRLKATTPENSIAVHGDGVNGVHGLLQRHEIAWDGNGEKAVVFTIASRAAAKLLSRTVGDQILSVAGRIPEAVTDRMVCPACEATAYVAGLSRTAWPGGYDEPAWCPSCGWAGKRSTKGPLHD